MVPDTAADGEEICPGLDNRFAIIDRDPANGDARDGHKFLPPGQDIGVCRRGDLFGGGRKERAKGHVIGAPFAGIEGKVAVGLAGDADDGLVTDKPPRVVIRCVILADMNTVATEFGGEIGTVIHDKGDVAVLRDGPQYIAGPPDVVVRHVFQAKLNAGDVAAIQSRRHDFRECFRSPRVERRRGDQVELAGFGANGARPCPDRF